MPMPLPYPVIRTRFLVKPDTNVVLTDSHGLTRVGFQRIGLATKDDPDDFLFEPGFFFGELGFATTILTVVFVVIVVVGEIGGFEEEVFEGLSVERVGGGCGGGRADLEATHESLEEEIVEVGGVGE